MFAVDSLMLSSLGLSLNTLTSSVTASKIDHVSHAVYFPRFAKHDTWSQPLNAWKKSSALDFEGPNCTATSWTGMYLKYLPTPKATHKQSTGYVQFVYYWYSNHYNVGINGSDHKFTYSIAHASATCNIIRVSASSWLQGDISLVSLFGQLYTTFWPIVETTILWSFVVRVNTQTTLSYYHRYVERNPSFLEWPNLPERFSWLLSNA